MDDEWDPPLPAGYGDANRAFIQAFMARGSLTFREAQELLAAIKTASASADGGGDGDATPVRPLSITPAEVDHAMRVAREAVEPLDYDVRNARDQLRPDGDRVWAFINAHSDPATQLGTARSPEEVAYVKRLLDAMFDTHNTPRLEVMAVDEGQALRVSRPPPPAGGAARRESNVQGGNGNNDDENNDDENGEDGGGGSTQAAAAISRGLKHSEVLSLLSSLVAEGWLDKSRDGFYSLTARSLMELWGWLMATYNDADADADAAEWQRIKFCEACKEIVTYGQRCNDPDCVIRLHDICEDAFWRARADRTCPKCSTAWEGTHFVGERAVTSRSGFQRRRRKSGRRSEAAAVEEAEEEAAEDEDDE